MTENILEIGATGNVDREVVRLLFDLDYPVTAAVRNPMFVVVVLAATNQEQKSCQILSAVRFT